jgi:hypothetical protein
MAQEIGLEAKKRAEQAALLGIFALGCLLFRD